MIRRILQELASFVLLLSGVLIVLYWIGTLKIEKHDPEKITILCKPIKWSSNTRNLFANCHIQSDNDLVLKQNILTFKLKGDPDNE